MLTAEFSQRGFIITGNEIYLAPYQSAKTQAQRQLLALEGSAAILPQLRFGNATPHHDPFRQVWGTRSNNRTKARPTDEDVLASLSNQQRAKALSDEANVFISGIIVKADERLTSGVV